MTLKQIAQSCDHEGRLARMPDADYRALYATEQLDAETLDYLVETHGEAHGEKARRAVRIAAAISQIPVPRGSTGLLDRLGWDDQAACNAARLLIRKGGEIAAGTRHYMRVRFEKLAQASDREIDESLLIYPGRTSWSDQRFPCGPWTH